MKKIAVMIVCLFTMMAASTGLKAQEISVLIRPGWNWIGYPYPETVDLGTAFGDFEPLAGDVIESCFEYSEYLSGYGWYGGVSELRPGWGYMYYSNRTEAVSIVLHAPASQTAVTTAMPTGITATSAVAGGMVILPEGSHVFLRGVCWGTMPSPDIDGSHTTEETGIGSFSSTLEGLNPNTTYYVRAYVVSDYGLAYGNELSFTTMSGIPVVTTAEVTAVTGNSALCGGTVTDDGGLAITARGVCWSTSHNPTLGDSHTTDGTGTGSFASSITGLGTSTTYYVRAYATTAQATSYGEELTFTTMNGIPTVSTAEVTDITATTATCGGTIATDGGLAITARGVCWSTSPNPTLSDSHTTGGTGTGSLSSSITGLEINTTYYIRAYATTSAGIGYGEQVSFTTRNGIPTVTTAEITNIGSGWAYSGGNITDDGGLAITERGVCWSLSPSPTLANSHTTNGSGAGSFSSYMTGLTMGTTYYVRAYATNSFVTVYGNQVSFTTADDYVYVDLGLPSGLLWATCNVGAEAPEDYGDYFAWSETQPKDTYNWSTYQYCNGSQNTLTKYCNNSSYGYNGFTDDLTTLLPEDDAATANWGSEWRMPTMEEWQELYNNTTVTWTQQNGVNGRLFTASNGNSLFLPAAGCRDGSGFISAGGSGYYWSSSLDTGYPVRACYFGFHSGGYGMGRSSRHFGYTVRPVCSLRQN